MKLILLSLLLSNAVHAHPIGPGKCGNAFQLNMWITEKLDENHYMAYQSIGPTNTSSASIETKTSTFQGRQRVTIYLEYIETKKLKGKDGFDHDVDFWRECTPKVQTGNSALEAIDRARLGL